MKLFDDAIRHVAGATDKTPDLWKKYFLKLLKIKKIEMKNVMVKSFQSGVVQ